uniref:Uncharacterized protein n=1 Tax=Oryza punctata TaxID=4537 RepID=A0A0E0ML73_ORYPU
MEFLTKVFPPWTSRSGANRLATRLPMQLIFMVIVVLGLPPELCCPCFGSTSVNTLLTSPRYSRIRYPKTLVAMNLKFFTAKGQPKIRYPCTLVYREMIINGYGYQVLTVTKWMKKHAGRTLEDFDRYYCQHHEDMALIWWNFYMSDRQSAITQRQYSIVPVPDPLPLRTFIDLTSDGESDPPGKALRLWVLALLAKQGLNPNAPWRAM